MLVYFQPTTALSTTIYKNFNDSPLETSFCRSVDPKWNCISLIIFLLSVFFFQLTKARLSTCRCLWSSSISQLIAAHWSDPLWLSSTTIVISHVACPTVITLQPNTIQFFWFESLSSRARQPLNHNISFFTAG